MTQAPKVENTAVAGLLRLLEESGAGQCEQLRVQAAEKIEAIRRQAYRQARQRIRRAVADERERMRTEIGRVEAEVETELRRRGLRRAAQLVEAGRAGLDQVLQERWQDAAARANWSASLLDLCERVLLGRDWLLQCPADWPEAERQVAIDRARIRAGAALEIKDDPELTAGLRLHCGGVTVDMSVAGLLSDRAAIEGALLHIHSRVGQGESE